MPSDTQSPKLKAALVTAQELLRCPRCDGKGTVRYFPDDTHEQMCTNCSGAGVLTDIGPFAAALLEAQAEELEELKQEMHHMEHLEGREVFYTKFRDRRVALRKAAEEARNG